MIAAITNVLILSPKLEGASKTRREYSETGDLTTNREAEPWESGALELRTLVLADLHDWVRKFRPVVGQLHPLTRLQVLPRHENRR